MHINVLIFNKNTKYLVNNSKMTTICAHYSYQIKYKNNKVVEYKKIMQDFQVQITNINNKLIDDHIEQFDMKHIQISLMNS